MCKIESSPVQTGKDVVWSCKFLALEQDPSCKHESSYFYYNNKEKIVNALIRDRP